MDFKDLNVKELDRNLSEEEKREWNAIYASYRAGSLLTGKVAGIDMTSVTVHNQSRGEPERTRVLCLAIIDYRVKVLIPEQEVWFDEKTKRPSHVLRSMTGSMIDYVIIGIDRENNCCVASRRLALQIRRRTFLKGLPEAGEKTVIDVLAVGASHMLAVCGGFDVTLSCRDLSYGMIRDLREQYHPGEKYTAVVKGFHEDKTPILSVKEAKPHPFDGAERRHPLNSRRASVISGKYKGGVFCKLEEELDCLCTYSQYQADTDFKIGDRVIVAITKFDYVRKLVYGRIVAKW